MTDINPWITDTRSHNTCSYVIIMEQFKEIINSSEFDLMHYSYVYKCTLSSKIARVCVYSLKWWLNLTSFAAILVDMPF